MRRTIGRQRQGMAYLLVRPHIGDPGGVTHQSNTSSDIVP